MQASATAHQITPWANNKGGAVSITFDDGATSQYTLAVPALNAQGFQGTFFVTTNWIDSATWDEWRDVSNQGHEMGSHTENHPHLPQLSLTEMIEEIGGSKAAIDAQIVTQQCLTFAYPFGEYDVNAKAVAEDYYLAARGISCDLNSVPYDFYDLRGMRRLPVARTDESLDGSGRAAGEMVDHHYITVLTGVDTGIGQ